jgi:PPOX class probable F420-dependent enzyme
MGNRLLDRTSEFGSRVDNLLTCNTIIWFTTVTPEGVPQPNPVWFYWDGQDIIIYSKPESRRIKNITHNPYISLHLEGAGVLGDNVVVIIGSAEIKNEYKEINEGYRKKYSSYLQEIGTTWQDLKRNYSIEIKVVPIKIRGI